MVWVVAVTVMVIPFTQQQITTVMVVKVVPGRSERMDHGGGNLFWGIGVVCDSICGKSPLQGPGQQFQ